MCGQVSIRITSTSSPYLRLFVSAYNTSIFGRYPCSCRFNDPGICFLISSLMQKDVESLWAAVFQLLLENNWQVEANNDIEPMKVRSSSQDIVFIESAYLNFLHLDLVRGLLSELKIWLLGSNRIISAFTIRQAQKTLYKMQKLIPPLKVPESLA